MIVRTDAVVLRSFDYGETSQIVTLLTRQHGIIGTLAKGARRPSSRFGSTLQPTSYIEAVYYHRAGRGLQTLTETAHLARFPRLRADLDRLTLALRALEVTRLTLGEGETHPLALEALARTLGTLDAAEDHAANALPWYQLHLAGLLGFAPDVQREAVQALDDQGVLRLDSGTIGPAEALATLLPGTGQIASRAALRAFAVLARTGLDTAVRMRLDEATREEVQSLVDAYLRVHIESAFPERVQAVSDQLRAGLTASGMPPPP